ncbi:MAG: ATP-binding protein [Desulfuromonadaceae bacterium]|nr:ATP-binding protein [Desulfuromonadaceae bacterium]MDD2847269.1 ATP-binding protein [Desulfuromonadaceae bacterium]MDD4130213.1 ATP-binding protein [Desulfuromonadaceae bacterium]
MGISVTGNEANYRSSSPTLLFALIAAGLAGNYFNYPIFLDIDFLFGSIFAMLALQFFGLGRGVVAAAIIAGYTCILWNHPYAIIIMTAEAASVGVLMGRRKIGMVLADTLYWLLIGMPLVFLFYHVIMHAPLGNTFITMTKQAVNGIANALIARLLFTGFCLRSRTEQMSYREIIYNLLAFFVLCPALIMLGVSSRTDFAETDRHLRTTLIQDSRRVTDRVETWVLNRKSAIINLAAMAATHTPQQMQPYLEQAKKADVNFQRVGLLNREAVTTAYFPLIDARGQSSIGKNFSDRPYVQTLRETRKPVLSHVVISRIGLHDPIVMMLAPVLQQGEYSGYCVGVLGLEQIRTHLDKSTNENAALYTLLDKNGKVIMTNRRDQTVMAPFVRDKGTLNRLDDVISQWVPAVAPNTPASERWRKSVYIAETTIGDLAEWRLIMEQPVAPYQRLLFANYTGKLTLLFFILLGALALAEFLSRRIVVTLGQLRALTYELPVKLAADGREIVWPESGIKEATHLINNFSDMADSLASQFNEVRQINESLEQRVEERTAELKKSEEAYRTVADFTYDWEYWVSPDGSLRYISPSCERHTGYSREEFLKDSSLMIRITHPDDRETFNDHLHVSLDAAEHTQQHHIDFRITTSSGEERWFAHVCQPVYDGDGRYLGQRATNRDITERKSMEVALREATAAAEAANIAKSRFLANMSHEIRTPMNGVIGLTDLLLETSLTAEQREYAELVKLSGRNLMLLISDILDLSKIEANRIELERQDFNLQAEISDAVQLLSLQARNKGLELKTVIDPDVPLLLQGDVGRLRQILTNLIGNAIKFTTAHGTPDSPKSPQDAVSLHIRQEAQDQRHVTLRFLVRDSGIGIAADKLESIFEPFTQADSSTTRTYGGTGLGLTISRQLAGLMGGTVGVESVLGEGTMFWFTARLEKQVEETASPQSGQHAAETINTVCNTNDS